MPLPALRGPVRQHEALGATAVLRIGVLLVVLAKEWMALVYQVVY